MPDDSVKDKCPHCGVEVTMRKKAKIVGGESVEFAEVPDHDVLACGLSGLDVDVAVAELEAMDAPKLTKRVSEDQIRQMMTELAHYAEDGETYDPAGDYLCGTCRLRMMPETAGEDRGKCLWVLEGTSGISMGTGSCDMYKHGLAPFGPEMELAHKFTQTDAGYAERPKAKGFGCARCEYAEKAPKEDAEGRELVCRNYEIDKLKPHIEPKACCQAHNGPDMVVAPGEKKEA